MKRVLIANRGEIAIRIARACRKAGIETVAVYSTADVNGAHLWAADRAVRIGGASASNSYLRGDAIVHTALATGCDAVHPGYGFLAENAAFARLCEDHGLTFVGPRPETIKSLGDKAVARRLADELGLPIVPGPQGVLQDVTEARTACAKIGYPVLLKARAGGGGRGMRVVSAQSELTTIYEAARAEAEAAFGDGGLYVERYFPAVHHVEVQVFGDGHGNAVHLWERECSVQRRHQKLLEEAPSPNLSRDVRTAICAAALRLTKHIRYRGAGTVEFLYDPEDQGFYFIEMNTRIQVEHPVTELLCDVDLVVEQLRIAGGEPLSWSTPPRRSGHVVEMRINAEDPQRAFAPCPGQIVRWRPPTGRGIRLDSHVYEGYAMPPFYDSLLGKLIVRGCDRTQAIDRSLAALAGFEVEGIRTTVPFHRSILAQCAFRDGAVHTRWVETNMNSR
ncbi:MAG: acetyl-CoA carboxylase biotin carboxylase subunit [Alphaproteobacteria bacterium]|nr:acetyl-CoA carboxylase biotin carboxylase subunit [Alphaproteobacteria bacterium]